MTTPARCTAPRPPHRMALAVFLLGLFSLLAPAATAGGTIEGQVKLPAAREAPVQTRRYEIVTSGGVVATNPPLAVVYLEGRFPAPATPPVAQVLQKDLTFSPHLLPIQVGTRVEFPNLDDTYHNVFSFSPPQRFDLGRYRPGDRPIPSQVFNTPGLVTLRCDIHDHMRAVILVLETPHFVVTGTDGRYRLPDVPAGRYLLKAWMNSRVTRVQEVEVVDGQVVRVDLP